MNDADDSVGWRQLREFADVDLSRSFVLSWHLEPATLLIDVDLYLMPEHPFYETPRPAEKVCIRAALIEFPFFVVLASDDLAEGTDAAEVIEGLGHGAISGLRRLADGRYELTGEFGRVLIDAERPILRFKGP